MRNGRRTGRGGRRQLCAGGAILLVVSGAWAGPRDGVVAAGDASIGRPSPSRTEVKQASSKAVIDWRSFSIGKDEEVVFQQPSSAAIALNRVTGPDASRIEGRLQANGQVWLVNPNGVLFGPTARVDVAGLVATTADIGNRDFMAGTYRFDKPGNPAAQVANEGRISIAEGGIAALVAPSVRNAGVIEARLGKVALAGGYRFTVDLHGDRLVNLAISEAQASRIENSGQLLADGGRVALTASAARDAVSEVVNTGVARARSVGQRNGVIVLDAGNGSATLAGALDAIGAQPGETGGTVSVTAERIALTETARIDVAGESGGGSARIGGGMLGADPSLGNAATVTVAQGARITADAGRRGHGGSVVLWSERRTSFAGAISARGGAENGDGGAVETSSRDLLTVTGSVDASARYGRPGEWLLDPKDVELRAASTANGSFSGGVFNPDGAANTPAIVDVGTLRTALNGGTSVTINTSSSFAGRGNITVVDPVTRDAGDSPATLTFNAAGDIRIEAGITRVGGGTGALNLALNATGDVTFNADIDIARNQGSASLNATRGSARQTAGSIKAFGLGINAEGTSLTQPGNEIAVLAGRSTGSNRGFAYAGATPVTIGTVAGISGITAGAGEVSLDAGAITQTGAIRAFSATFIARGGSIELNQANNIGSYVSLQATADASLVAPSGAIIRGINVGGDLTLNFAGGIFQYDGAIVVGGSSNLVAGGSPIHLVGMNRFSGPIRFSSSSEVTLVNGTDTILGAGATASGSLAVVSGAGISQAGALNVGGTSSFESSIGNIELTAANQLAGAIALSTAFGGNASLRNNRSTVLGNTDVRGDLTVSSAGAISQAGVVNVGGASSFTADRGTIALDGNLNLLAGALSLSARGATTVHNNMPTVLGAATVQADFSLISEGPIRQTGPLMIFGSSRFVTQYGDISLTQANTLLGPVTLRAFTGTAALTNATDTVLGDWWAAGDLIVNSAGTIAQTNELRGSGLSSFTAGDGPINLTRSNELAGPISLFNSGNHDATLTNAFDTNLSASTVGRNLTVTAMFGDVVQSGGTIAVGGAAAQRASSGAVRQTGGNITASALEISANRSSILAQTGNDVGTLAASITGDRESLSYVDANALTIGAVGTVSGLTADTVLVRTLGQGALTLARPVTARAGSGDSIVLAADGFLLNSGHVSLSTSGTARYLLYSRAPGGTELGGVMPSAKLYGSSFDARPPAQVPGAQSTILYGITPTLTVTVDDKTREYGLANPALTYRVAGFIDGDTPAAAMTGTPALATSADVGSNVGSYAITGDPGSLASSLGYGFALTSGSLTVMPAPLTVTVADASREYGLANPVFAASVSGLRNGDAPSVLSGLQLSTPATIAADVGRYAIQSAGGSAGNYRIAARTEGVLDVTPAPLTVRADDQVREYGLANPALTATFNGLRNGDSPSAVSGLALGTAATMLADVGGYAITSTGGTAGNYTIVGRTDGTLRVIPAPLAATADDKSREYGLANPAFTGTLTGFRNGDTAAVVSGFGYAATAAPGSDVGTYAITPLGGTALNYAIATRANGTLRVTPAPLTLIADDKSRTAGQPNPMLTARFTGLRNGDDASVVGGYVLSTAADAGASPGSYPILSSGGAARNYTIQRRIDGTLTVLPAAVAPVEATAAAGGVVNQMMDERMMAANAPRRGARMSIFDAATTPGGAVQIALPAAPAIDPFRLSYVLGANLGAIAPAAGPTPAGEGEQGGPTAWADLLLGDFWHWEQAQAD